MPQAQPIIRTATAGDAVAVAAIYNTYIASSHATFETEAVDKAGMAARIARVGTASLPWLVAVMDGTLVAYAYASPWKAREAYRHSVETSIYIDPAHVGKGIGVCLYADLLTALRERPLHAVIGGIALPNEASVALHERLGFRKVAHFEQVGHKLGRWIDVGYWQLVLQG
ncbi:MAG TPA: arsinothricin resistance N-acetyltransferase ArsN1 family B [Oleiagrimonas sp.]|nr:arsinothricin resistance N-acetyltransferase ArsN1 family B [Oleiagrimonas sp.]